MVTGIQLGIHRGAATEHVVEVEPEALEVGQRACRHVCRRLGGLVKIEVVVDELTQVRVLRRQRGAVVGSPAIDTRRVRPRVVHCRREIGRSVVGVVECRQVREHRPEAHRGAWRRPIHATAGTRRPERLTRAR